LKFTEELTALKKAVDSPSSNQTETVDIPSKESKNNRGGSSKARKSVSSSVVEKSVEMEVEVEMATRSGRSRRKGSPTNSISGQLNFDDPIKLLVVGKKRPKR
jgi:hypothetical protein